jgi:hypothetical protein
MGIGNKKADKNTSGMIFFLFNFANSH